MKTSLVTHGWLDCPLPGYRGKDGECRRMQRWLNHYAPLDLDTYILNNGPTIHTTYDYAHIIELTPHLECDTFKWNYPHVWRNYWHIKDLLQEYDRVFYFASDAYILSERLLDWILGRTDGWTALWCPEYRMPEPQIQVITECEEFMDFFSGECAPMRYNGCCEEITLPYTHVENKFVGDRYGDLKPPPPYAEQMDYYCQVPDDFDWDDSQFPKPRGKVCA